MVEWLISRVSDTEVLLSFDTHRDLSDNTKRDTLDIIQELPLCGRYEGLVGTEKGSIIIP
jgi:hypothetical protein